MEVVIGLSRIEAVYRMQPNEGIHHTGRTGLLVGLVAGSVFGLWAGLEWGLVMVLGLGVLVRMDYGITAWFYHYLLRLVLVQQGVIPIRYVPFLDYTTERILLRKVGGGYIFIHRLLLDYFAKQYTGPETTE